MNSSHVIVTGSITSRSSTNPTMMFAASAKAERELGLRVMSVDSALRAACAWFIANGYAPAAPKSVG